MKMLDLGVRYHCSHDQYKRRLRKICFLLLLSSYWSKKFWSDESSGCIWNRLYQHANKNIVSFAMVETKEAVENLDAILSVPNLTGIYIGPADMSSSYGLPPKFDVREDPVFSNIK